MEDVGGLTAAALRRAFGGRRVLLTGHTGFKGSWLALWLADLGAEVTGLALAPDTQPSAFEAMALAERCRHVIADVRDRAAVTRLVAESRPEVVLHLAAQAIVRRSYRAPVETFETNVLGTANLLAALKEPCAIVVVTSDKCYENPGDGRALREDARLGGHDPYSASKAAQELVVETFRKSYGLRVASARAGNVIGGGDWAEDRLLPDAVRSLLAGRAVTLRNPRSTRPWQHVIEPLGGYLTLAAHLLDNARFAQPYNFGPDEAATVSEVVDAAIAANGGGAWVHHAQEAAPHEAAMLHLDNSRAKAELGWSPRWTMESAVLRSVQWYRAHARGASAQELRERSLEQIGEWLEAA